MDSVMLRLVVFCAFFVFVRGQTTNVTQCILNEGRLPINQYVEGCADPPCALPQLQDAVVNVTFIATRNITSMRTLATVSFNFGIVINTEYNLGANAVTCNFLTNTSCPLVTGEFVQYTLHMYITRLFPVGISADVEFRVVDESNDEALWCIRVPITIRSPIAGNRADGTLDVVV